MTGSIGGARGDRTPEAVVLDLGGVLVDWNPHALYRTLLPPADVDAFLEEVGFLAWNHEQDAGRPLDEGVEAHAALFPHHRELFVAYRERFAETLVGEVPGSVAVLEALAARRVAGLRLFALTNWSAELFPVARARFAWRDRFDAVLVSGEERLAKPDPAVFRLLAVRHRFDPARAVFVDDALRNVAAARAAGYVALQFRDASRLRADLTALGVLPSSTG